MSDSDNSLPEMEASNSATVTQNMMEFSAVVQPILDLGKQIRDRLKEDEWGDEMAAHLGLGVITFFLNQYMGLISQATAAAVDAGLIIPGAAA